MTKHSNCFLSILVLSAAMGLAARAFACDVPDVEKSIDWFRSNDPISYDGLLYGCGIYMSGNTDKGLNEMLESYRDGQSHYADATAALAECDDADLTDICHHYGF